MCWIMYSILGEVALDYKLKLYHRQITAREFVNKQRALGL